MITVTGSLRNDLASLSGRFSAATDRLPLTIELADPFVVPTDPREKPHITLDRHGRIRTKVRAALEGVTPGDHVVTLRLDTFDHEINSHAQHPSGPDLDNEQLVGLFQDLEELDIGREANCTITVDATGGGHCDLLYRAGEVGGRLMITGEAEVDSQTLQARAVLDIKIPDLVDLKAQLQRPGDKFNNGTDTHPEPNYVADDVFTQVELLREEWERKPRPEGEPGAKRTYLSFNDQSLPWGGLFDLNQAWTIGPGHEAHRRGRSVDLNRVRHLVENEGQVELPAIDDPSGGAVAEKLREELEEVCAVAGTRLIPKEDDPNLHCEF